MRPTVAHMAAAKYRSQKSLEFNGVSDWAANFNLFGGSTFIIHRNDPSSVSMWVRVEGGDFSTCNCIISRWFPHNSIFVNEGGWRWYLHNAQGGASPTVPRALVFNLCTNLLNGLWVYSQSSFPFDQWVHVCMTYDGSGTLAGLKMYWDAVLQPIYTIYANWGTDAINSNAYSHLLWGTQYTAFPGYPSIPPPTWPPVLDYWFEGKMDEPAFWRHELTAYEVGHLHHGGYPADPMHIGLPNNKHVERYFRFGEYTDGAVWIPGNLSLSFGRYPVGGTFIHAAWNNDGVLPSLRITEDVAP